MLGHRGCRVGITYPEVTAMQVRAILEAAVVVAKKGKKVLPEIMVPLVGHVNELARQAELVRSTAEEVFTRTKFRVPYLVAKILPADPFVTIDVEGVGRLVRLAVDEGRAAKPRLKIGICGEHGGEPASVEFCHAAGLDYVSCSPFRVPIARLAAAQAALRGKAAESDRR